jgi:PAS domain S-box-containing protein
MPFLVEVDPADTSSARQDLLDEPEQASLLRLTKLVEHLFDVPVAYMALLGPGLKVVSRIGSGSEHWPNLQTFPLAKVLQKPVMWPDPNEAAAEDFDSGEIEFAASSPLRSSTGLDLGVLVIADVRPRPDFGPRQHQILAELAAVLAGKMELRVMACQGRESEIMLQEAEHRFRSIANFAPVMIIYSGSDGSVSFVNKAWLAFTGRGLEEELEDGYTETFHPDHRDRVEAAYWEAFQQRQPVTVIFPMRRHDGAYRWMEARGMPRFFDDGSFAGYIGCFIDMTEQREALRDEPRILR